MDAPFELKIINAVNHWKKEGFNNFKIHEKDNFEFGITFEKGDEKRVIALKTYSEEEQKLGIGIINNILFDFSKLYVFSRSSTSRERGKRA